MSSESSRRSQVTDEHLPIHSDLLGRELATVRRRAAALTFDSVLAAILVTPWILFWGLVALHLQAPSVLPEGIRWIEARSADVEGENGENEEETSDEQDRAEADEFRAWSELIDLVARRRPDLLTAEALEGIREGRYETAQELLFEDATVLLQLGDSRPSTFDRSTNTYHFTRPSACETPSGDPVESRVDFAHIEDI